MPAPSLKDMLARVGEEKARVRHARSGRPAEGEFLDRVQECLDLYEELAPLRFARLVAELGSEEAARKKLRVETEQSAREQEAMLQRVQARLYGNRP